jgi:hypothetical protein
VTAGIYVGQQEADPDKGRLMGSDHLISNKETLSLEAQSGKKEIRRVCSWLHVPHRV